MHYGAPQPQITLHTGNYQVGTRGNHVTFAAVSDSLQHGPAAIWAFMTLILEEIKTKHSNVDYIQFYSDGPSTQYCQKNNFFFLVNLHAMLKLRFRQSIRIQNVGLSKI